MGTTDARGIYYPVEGEEGWADEMDSNLGMFAVADGFEWEKWSTSQTIPNHTGPSFGGYTTVIGWETEPNIGSSGSLAACFNPSTGVFTPDKSGWYYIQQHVQFAPHATGWREAACTIVHSQLKIPSPGGGALDAARVVCSGVTYLDGPGNEHGRFFTAKVDVRQTSGGNLDVTYAAFHIAQLMAGDA